jgi:hypothetical protein
MMRRLHQRGAAILAAMLTVTLVATFAAAALWQQYRSVEVEAAERTRVQAGWILTGMLDWARLILGEDAKSGGADHLAEPWSVPLQEARLSTFLAQDRNNSSADAVADNAFLSGQIIDRQSLLNVNNLVEAGRLSETGLRSFQRLFELLGLPQQQLNRMAENLRFASDISTDNRSSSQAPLAPQKVEQLVWLGLPVQTVAVLEPYVTVLPARTGQPEHGARRGDRRVGQRHQPGRCAAPGRRARPRLLPHRAGRRQAGARPRGGLRRRHGGRGLALLRGARPPAHRQRGGGGTRRTPTRRHQRHGAVA